jgi:hypothetical protein
MKDSSTQPRRISRLVATAAIAAGLGVGSYGIASAATGGSTTTNTTTATAAPSGVPSAPPGGGSAPSSAQPWGGQRSDETPLTGDALAKVKAVALAKVPGGTVVRVETDADGNAAYEAHMTTSDGALVTVYVDKSFDYVSTDTR